MYMYLWAHFLHRILYHNDIISRELAGTPPIKDVFQAAMSLQLKDWFGIDNIEEIESKYCKEFMDYFTKHPRVYILGNQVLSSPIQLIGEEIGEAHSDNFHAF